MAERCQRCGHGLRMHAASGTCGGAGREPGSACDCVPYAPKVQAALDLIAAETERRYRIESAAERYRRQRECPHPDRRTSAYVQIGPYEGLHTEYEYVPVCGACEARLSRDGE